MQWVKDPALSLCGSGHCCGVGLIPTLEASHAAAEAKKNEPPPPPPPRQLGQLLTRLINRGTTTTKKKTEGKG